MWLLRGGRSDEDPTDDEAERSGKAKAIHFHIADEPGNPGQKKASELELDAMYDFSQFAPNGERSREPVDPEMGVYERLREQQEAMELHMEAQAKKLSSASKALKKARAQVQQLTAQVSLKDIDCKKMEAQVAQLRNLLTEKERRLQEALDSASVSQGPRLELCEPEQPTEELVNLTRVTEQLTASLQLTQRQLAATATELAIERRQREQLQAERAALLSRPSTPSGQEEERARRHAIEQHLAARSGGRFHPHLEV